MNRVASFAGVWLAACMRAVMPHRAQASCRGLTGPSPHLGALLLPPVQMDLRQAQAAIATVEKRLQGETMPAHFSRPCQLGRAHIGPTSSACARMMQAHRQHSMPPAPFRCGGADAGAGARCGGRRGGGG